MGWRVVVPAYNEEGYLAKTLESVKNQEFKNFELIVVCNGCTDGSEGIARKYTDNVFTIKEKNVSKARNFGAAKAKNAFLVFLDADTLLGEGVLGKVNKVVLKDRYFGTAKGKGEGFRNGAYLGFKNIINKFLPWNQGFVYCDKRSFFEVGGFNSNLLKGELRDFFSKAKGKYKRINVYVEPSDRRVKEWGLRKLIKYWLFEKKKKDYDAVR
jgi:glycosyltransferase involved in cell wall biosynthesis